MYAMQVWIKLILYKYLVLVITIQEFNRLVTTKRYHYYVYEAPIPVQKHEPYQCSELKVIYIPEKSITFNIWYGHGN